MIELLGVGVRHRQGGWLVRNVCARLEAGEVTLVVSPQPEGRRALIEALAGSRVPDGPALGEPRATAASHRLAVSAACAA